MNRQFIIAFVATIVCTKDVTSSGCLSDVDDVYYPKSIRSDLYRGQQAFTMSMLNAINNAAPNDNIFFSPYSTYHALLLAYFGARNATEAELIKALNLGWAQNKNHVRQAYQFEKVQRLMRSKSSDVDFVSADRIFFAQEATLHVCMRDLFYEELETMNFHSNPEECRTQINSWIANMTRNEILEVLSPRDINADTNLVLANAAYFKGQWESKFDSKDTKKDAFYITETKSFMVDMMQKRGTYNLAIDERLGADVLEIPYLTGDKSDISMVIVLPPLAPNSLDVVLQNLTPETLSKALKDGRVREIDISLPKFELEQNVELLPILNKIGINDLFTTKADLSGFSSNKQLSLGEAKHVAKIKVDEEGSTAAAATVLFTSRSSRRIEPFKFECNHPFLFLIYDHKTQAILFIGILRDQIKQK